MKNPDREKVSELTKLPNIGKAMAADLRLLGIGHPKKLIGKDPFVLHEALCAITGKKQDPCVIDVFMAAIRFMEGGEALPWWAFTDERKEHLARRDRKKMVDIFTVPGHTIRIDNV